MIAEAVGVQVAGTGPEVNPRLTPPSSQGESKGQTRSHPGMLLDPLGEMNVSVCLHPLHRASQDSKAWSTKDTRKPGFIKMQTILFEERCWYLATTATLRDSLLLVRLRFSWEVCVLHRLGSLTQLRRRGSGGLQQPPQGPSSPD